MKHRAHVNPFRSIGFIVSSIAIGFGLHLALENFAAAAPLSGPLLSALGSLQTAKALLERDSGPDSDGSRARALQATNEAIDALKGAMNPLALPPLSSAPAAMNPLALPPRSSAPAAVNPSALPPRSPAPAAMNPSALPSRSSTPAAMNPSALPSRSSAPAAMNPSALPPRSSAAAASPSAPAACAGCATSASGISIVTTSSNTYTTQDIQAAFDARKGQLLKCLAKGWHPNTEGRLDYAMKWDSAQGKVLNLQASVLGGPAMNSAVLLCMNSAIAGGTIKKTPPILGEKGALVTLRITQ